MQKGLSAVIFGSTGAVGKTLVLSLLESQKWQKVHCVVRKQPEQWTKHVQKGKLTIQVQPDMDKLFKTQDWKLNGYDTMFVCFGSQVKHGQQTFTKIDKTYPLLCADIAINNNIPHYQLVSSAGGDTGSMFLYTRIKGEVERDLKQKKLNMLSILKPGLIKNRPDARTGEKVAQFFSFLPFPQVQCLDLAKFMILLAEDKAQQAPKSKGNITVYDNANIVEYLKKKK